MKEENLINSEDINPEKELKEENIFNLSYDLFHLKLKRKRLFTKSTEFKPHLIRVMKKKIALLKAKGFNK